MARDGKRGASCGPLDGRFGFKDRGRAMMGESECFARVRHEFHDLTRREQALAAMIWRRRAHRVAGDSHGQATLTIRSLGLAKRQQGQYPAQRLVGRTFC